MSALYMTMLPNLGAQDYRSPTAELSFSTGRSYAG